VFSGKLYYYIEQIIVYQRRAIKKGSQYLEAWPKRNHRRNCVYLDGGKQPVFLLAMKFEASYLFSEL
jgi:hypothetical protein